MMDAKYQMANEAMSGPSFSCPQHENLQGMAQLPLWGYGPMKVVEEVCRRESFKICSVEVLGRSF